MAAPFGNRSSSPYAAGAGGVGNGGGSSSTNTSRVDLASLRSQSISGGLPSFSSSMLASGPAAAASSSLSTQLAQDGSGGDASLSPRSKLVSGYRALLSGEQPWATAASASSSSGKRRAAPRDEYLYGLLTVPVPSVGQLAHLFHTLLPPASPNTAFALIDDDPGSAGARIRDNISGLWARAVALWLALPSAEDDGYAGGGGGGGASGRSGLGGSEHLAALSSPLRLNALQTLIALSSVILSQRFPNYALDLINVLAGSISEADDLFIQLVVGIDDVLSEDFPRAEHGSPELEDGPSAEAGTRQRGMRPAQHLHLQHLTLQLLLLWLSHTSSTSVGTYFLRRDLFLSLTSFLERSALTSRFGFEIGLAMGLLAGVGQQGGALGMGAGSKRASLMVAHGAGPNPLSSSHPYIRHCALWYAASSSSARSLPEAHVPRPGMDTLVLVGAVALERQGWRLYVAVQPDGEDPVEGEAVTYAEAGANAIRAIVGAPIKGAQVIGDEVVQLSGALRDSLRWIVGANASPGSGSPGAGAARSASEFAHLPTAPAAFLLPIYLLSRSNAHFIHSSFYGNVQSSRRPSKMLSSASPDAENADVPAPAPPPPDLPVSVLSFASYLLTHASVPPPTAATTDAYTFGVAPSPRTTTLLPRARAYARLLLCLLWVWLSSEIGEAVFLKAEPLVVSPEAQSSAKELGSASKVPAAQQGRVSRVRRCKQREHVSGSATGSASTLSASSSSALAGSSFLPAWASFGKSKAVASSAEAEAAQGAQIAADGPRLIGCLLDVCGAYVRNNVSLRLDVRSFSVALRIIRRSMLLLSAARIRLKTTSLSPAALASLTSAQDMPGYNFTGVILRPLLSLARFLANRSANELRLSAAAISFPGSAGSSGTASPSSSATAASTAALTGLIKLLLLTISTYLVNADRLLPSTAEVHELIYELVRESKTLRKLADGLVREELGRDLDSLPMRPGQQRATASARLAAASAGNAHANASASLAADEVLRSVGWSLALEPVLDAVDTKVASSASKARTVHRDPASVMRLIAELDLEALLGAASLVGAETASSSSTAMVGPGLVPLSSPAPAPDTNGVGPTAIGGVAPSSFSTFRDGFSSGAPRDATAASESESVGRAKTRVSALLDRGELDEAWFEEVEEGALAEVARVVAVDARELLPLRE